MAEKNVEQCPRCGAPAVCVSRSTFEQYEPSGFRYDPAAAKAEAIRDLLTGETEGPWGIEHAGPHLTEQQARAVANALNALEKQ